MNPIDISEKAGVRYLHFGSTWVQGAMRIARPFDLELDYTREMMTPLLLRNETWPRRVLQIGLGTGSVSKFLYRHRPQCRLTVVEIDPRVEIAARQFFKLPDDPKRIAIHHADGADFVVENESSYDLILIDGFDADAGVDRLDTLPFYLNCRARLADDGLLSINLLSRRKNFDQSLDRLQHAFDRRVVVFPACNTGNVIALACIDTPPMPTLDELNANALTLKQSTGLDLLPTLKRLAQTPSLAAGVLRF